MRRVTLITLIVLFVALAAAAVYQLTLGRGDRTPLCGPSTPLEAPDPADCPSP